MNVTRFAAPLGARISGLDVRSIDDETWVTLDALFVEHKVLAFPGQTLTPNELKAFARRWGELVEHPYASMRDHPEIIELRNGGKTKNPNEHWHSDMPYNECPPKLTMLSALEAPELGGDTAFANQVMAFDALSEALQDLLDGLAAVNSAEGLARFYKQDPAEAPRAEHPVIRTHDQSGLRSLYVSRAFTTRFAGMRSAESRGLLEFLFEHSARPDFQARHRWQRGDVVMWDNRSVLHYAVHDHGDAARTIHRVQVQGPVPV